MSTELELDGMAHLPPVGGDHVGGCGQAGRLTELGHDLPAGVPVLGATGILGVSEDVLLAAAQTDGLVEGPCTIGVEGDAGLGETLGQGTSTASISSRPPARRL